MVSMLVVNVAAAWLSSIVGWLAVQECRGEL